MPMPASIRLAVEADLLQLVTMAERFVTSPDYRGKLSVKPDQLGRFLLSIIVEKGRIWVLDRSGTLTGAIGLLLYPHPMDGETTAVELFWWVNPEVRGEGLRLLRIAEDAAKESGAKRMQMIAPNERVAKLYERKGYERVETMYQRAL